MARDVDPGAAAEVVIGELRDEGVGVLDGVLIHGAEIAESTHPSDDARDLPGVPALSRIDLRSRLTTAGGAEADRR